MSSTITQTVFTIDQLKPSARLIADEFLSRGAEIEVHDDELSIFSYCFDEGPRSFFHASNPIDNSHVSGIVTKHKHIASRLMSQYGLHVPREHVTSVFDEACDFLERHGTVVLKPIDGAHGTGVVTDITNTRGLRAAWPTKQDESIIIQEQCDGQDMRIVMLYGEVLYALIRNPATVVGDGVHHIADLITIENKIRDNKPDSDLKRISVKHARQYVGKTRYEAEVPTKGRKVRVCGPANQSIGGTLHEYTDKVVLDELKPKLATITRELGMALVAFDFMVDNETQSGTFIECNTAAAIWSKQPGAVRRIVDAVIERQVK